MASLKEGLRKSEEIDPIPLNGAAHIANAYFVRGVGTTSEAFTKNSFKMNLWNLDGNVEDLQRQLFYFEDKKLLVVGSLDAKGIHYLRILFECMGQELDDGDIKPRGENKVGSSRRYTVEFDLSDFEGD